MYSMHRTQIIIEEWQYQTLRSRAEREDCSISELVREILCTALEQSPRRKSRLQTIEGIGEDQSTHGREHDLFLYGAKGTH